MMTGAHKTISETFGTYSCVIEGIENSRDALDGIASYFDSLTTGEDTAIMPLPDAERLAEIAAKALGGPISVTLENKCFLLRPKTPARAMAGQVPDPSDQAHIDDSSFRHESLAEKLKRIRGLAMGEETVVSPTSLPTPKPVDEPPRDAEPVRATEEFLALRRGGAQSVVQPDTPEISAADHEAESTGDPDNIASDIPPDTAQTGDPATMHKPVEETIPAQANQDDLAGGQVNVERGIQSLVRHDRANRALKDQGGAKDEEDIWRLLDEANMQLESTAGNHRRSVFSHLKAAVTARFSDRKSAEETAPEPPDQTEPYRSDLADVVRPAPAKPETEPVEQPQPDQAQAPQLVLDDGQIIDSDTAAPPSGPAPESTSFADFAKTMGATGIRSLMESAAAYTSLIQGQAHFSRAEVMEIVKMNWDGLGFNHQEGLQAFGQLLREGVIEIVSRGKYAITAKSRYCSSPPA